MSNRNAHAHSVDVDGELFFNVSMMSAEIDIASNIFWKLDENIFGFYLSSPMQIRRARQTQHKHNTNT